MDAQVSRETGGRERLHKYRGRHGAESDWTRFTAMDGGGGQCLEQVVETSATGRRD